MSSKPKQTKIYKNPKRDAAPKFNPYVPQYKVLGKAPEQVNFANAPNQSQVTHHAPILVRETPRGRVTPTVTPPKSVPYAQPSQFVLGNNMPNVGNNMETSWASVDGVTLDEDEVEIVDQEMVDNNLDDDDNYGEIPETLPLPPDTEVNLPSDEETSSQDEYILFVDNQMLGGGSLELVENGVRELIFEQNVSPDKIAVYKKVPVKVGVFIAG